MNERQSREKARVGPEQRALRNGDSEANPKHWKPQNMHAHIYSRILEMYMRVLFFPLNTIFLYRTHVFVGIMFANQPLPTKKEYYSIQFFCSRYLAQEKRFVCFSTVNKYQVSIRPHERIGFYFMC